MPGINTTGVPSVDEYSFGGGIIYLASLDANGYPKDFRDVGNTSEFTSSISSESLDHYSTRAGLRTKDATVTIQTDASVAFTLDNINMNNLALFFSGTTNTFTNPAIAGLTATQFVQDGNLKVNAWYQLRVGTSPVFGITTTNAMVITTTETVPVTLTKGTDYTVDAVTGMVFILSTDETLAAIAAGKGLKFTLTADAAATTVDQLKIMADTQATVALRFKKIDASTGKVDIYDFRSVVLSANGDFSLISEEWAGLPLTGSVEKSDAYDNVADMYVPVKQ